MLPVNQGTHRFLQCCTERLIKSLFYEHEVIYLCTQAQIQANGNTCVVKATPLVTKISDHRVMWRREKCVLPVLTAPQHFQIFPPLGLLLKGKVWGEMCKRRSSQLSVDGRPTQRGEEVFSNLAGLVWTWSQLEAVGDFSCRILSVCSVSLFKNRQRVYLQTKSYWWLYTDTLSHTRISPMCIYLVFLLLFVVVQVVPSSACHLGSLSLHPLWLSWDRNPSTPASPRSPHTYKHLDAHLQTHPYIPENTRSIKSKETQTLNRTMHRPASSAHSHKENTEKHIYTHTVIVLQSLLLLCS